MERWGPDGRKMDITPAEVAMIDQIGAKFKQVTAKLLNLQAQARTLAALPGGPDTELAMREVSLELFRTLLHEFPPDGGLSEGDHIFSYVMYLIDTLAIVMEDDDGLTETYTTGVGQELQDVHPKGICTGWCVIHNPVPGPWQQWPTVWRGDGPGDIWRGFERQCPHGVGHPAVEEILRGRHDGSHGCCEHQCPCLPRRATPIISSEGELQGYV